MLPINSLSGALVQSAQLQIEQSAEKARQARKAQDVARNVAARDEDEVELEHPVENTEELTAIHDENNPRQKERKRQQHQEEPEAGDGETSDGLDLQA